MILDAGEFQTKELERALQLKGWRLRWMDSSEGVSACEGGLTPSALIVNSGRGDASIRSIRAFRDKDPFIPLVIVGENAMGFPMGADAFIPHGAMPDAWLAALDPFWPADAPQETRQTETSETFGRYKLIRKIASGGMADIFLAEQVEPKGFNRTLAIKRLLPRRRLDPVFIKMLFDEASLAAKLDHQNIVRVFDVGIESGVHYIAMEYVDGANLQSLIGKAKELGIAFPEPIAAFLIIQAAEALDYAHRRRDGEGRALNLVHSDISPQNILVNREGVVKLIDFGIAKAAASTPEQEKTGDGASLHGKLLYMSPEQSLGGAIDHRSDIFSLGLVLFEMLTAEHCFQADDEYGLLEKVRTGIVRNARQVNPGVSRPMARILNNALRKNASSRYSSARRMALDLRAYLEHLHLESLENDVLSFVKMLRDAQPQTRAFVTSRFAPIRSDTALPSEKTLELSAISQGKKKATKRPAWILPTVSLLLVFLAYLFWASMRF